MGDQTPIPIDSSASISAVEKVQEVDSLENDTILEETSVSNSSEEETQQSDISSTEAKMMKLVMPEKLKIQ